MQNHPTQNTLSFQHFLKFFTHCLWLFILWAIIAGGIGFAVTRFVVTPQYTASSEIMVNQQGKSSNATQSLNNQQTAVQLVNTYKDYITSQGLLRTVHHQLADPTIMQKYGVNHTYHLSVADLKKMIKVDNEENSQIFTINVQSSNPQKSMVITNVITNSFKHQVKNVMHFNNIIIISRAITPHQPSSPNVFIYTAVSALLGLIVSFIVLLIREYISPKYI